MKNCQQGHAVPPFLPVKTLQEISTLPALTESKLKDINITKTISERIKELNLREPEVRKAPESCMKENHSFARRKSQIDGFLNGIDHDSSLSEVGSLSRNSSIASSESIDFNPFRKQSERTENIIAFALYDYKSQDERDLSFKAGEFISIVSKSTPEGKSKWWIGRKNGDQGLLPSNYVKELRPSVATENYQAEDEEELTVRISDRVYIVDDSNEHWTLCYNGYSTGYLPSKVIEAATYVNSFSSKIATFDASQYKTWSSMMSVLLPNITTEEQKRQEAIFELILTEQKYVRNLMIVLELFYYPSLPILTEDDSLRIFSNLEDIFSLNSALLVDLEELQKRSDNFIDCVADIVLPHVRNV